MSCDNVSIRVSHLTKCYQMYETPRDRLKQFVMPRLQRLAGRPARSYFNEFWALEDVSFELKRGETVGVIGRNGSGKSTLLQIICGTLAPTGGLVETRGRIAALLELGAGFNPDYTGRENVYMNAAVLGLTREQVDARFDEIAAFADIGEFMDQPVKVYSSGMYVRLAFAVIAHVDADILVVDEALAVGDAIFAQKCMRFIRSFQERGTLLFVSHDMASVQNLCKTALWLSEGRVRLTGAAKHVAEAYLQYTLQEVYGDEVRLNSTQAKDNLDSATDEDASTPQVSAVDYGGRLKVTANLANAGGWKTGVAEITSATLDKLDPGPAGIFAGGERVRMSIEARATSGLEKPILGFLVRDRLGQDLFGENTLPFTAVCPCSVAPGQVFVGTFEFRLPMLPDGQYVVMASVADGDQRDNVQHHYLHDALIINVSSSRVRWGLVGIPFERVSLAVADTTSRLDPGVRLTA